MKTFIAKKIQQIKKNNKLDFFFSSLVHNLIYFCLLLLENCATAIIYFLSIPAVGKNYWQIQR